MVMERITIDGDETTAMRPTGETRLIVCGWCGIPTDPARACRNCRHERPAQPWEQRGQEPPQVEERRAGRPGLDASQARERVRIAQKKLGKDATNAQLAEELDVAESTVRKWRKDSGL